MDFFFEALSFWHWPILAVIFLLLEMITGSGFLLWLAVGAFLMFGLMSFIPGLYWPLQLLFFSAFSIAAVLSWWRYLKGCTEKNDNPNLNQRTKNYIGRTFDLTSEIKNGRGKVKIGDSFWNVEGEDLPVGTTVKVVDATTTLLQVVKAD